MKNIGKIVDNKDIANKKYVDDNSAIEWSTGVDGVIKTNSNGSKSNMPSTLDLAESITTQEIAPGNTISDSWKATFTSTGIKIATKNIRNYGYSITEDTHEITAIEGALEISSTGTIQTKCPNLFLFSDTSILLTTSLITVSNIAKSINLNNVPVINNGVKVVKGLLYGTISVKVSKYVGKPSLFKIYKCTNRNYPEKAYDFKFHLYGTAVNGRNEVPIDTFLNQKMIITTADQDSKTLVFLELTETEDSTNYIYTLKVMDEMAMVITNTSASATNIWDVDFRFLF